MGNGQPRGAGSVSQGAGFVERRAVTGCDECCGYSRGLSMDAAFDRLRRYARSHNARLSEVARKVIETDLAAEVLCTSAVADRVVDQR